MRALIFFIIIIPFVLLIMAQCHEKPEHLKTESEKIADLLEDLTFNTPKEITVLFNNDYADQKTREKIKTLILKTDEEYLPKSPKISNKPETVLNALHTSLPDHDFGKPSGTEANYFRWLTSNSEWTVSAVKTSQGYFSHWQKVTDVHQLSRDE